MTLSLLLTDDICQEQVRKFYTFLIMSLKRSTSYLSYSAQLVLCELGVGGIGLYFPLPLRSHYCVMATVLANRPVPPFSFPSYITAALSGIRELVWVRLQLLSLSLLMLIRQSLEQWAHSRPGQIRFRSQKVSDYLDVLKDKQVMSVLEWQRLISCESKHLPLQCILFAGVSFDLWYLLTAADEGFAYSATLKL